MRFFHCNHCARNVYIKSVIIAATQLPLNRLRHKSKQEAKQVETRQKIILGAEVAKAINSNIFDVDIELILGFLSYITRLSDEEKIKYKKRGWHSFLK
ncbi:conjugal transfer protein TraD [Raoultella ornithinolytica]|uniref:conjugal transfer protein TraD n=1 Tax=Raoultella ornithinolytica TaxID=54291 RepID=UPI00387829D7